MTQQNTATTELIGERELIMSRRFNAPRALVWEAWTDREQFEQWWGPEGFQTEVRAMDVRPGGTLHFVMRSAEWGDAWAKMIFIEVVPPERIVVDDLFSDEEGNVPEDMPKTRMTVTFNEDGDGTILKMHSVYASQEDRQKVIDMGFEEGWWSTLRRLEQFLAAR